MWFQVRLSLCGNEHLSTLYFKGASSKHRKTPRRENVSAFFVCRKKDGKKMVCFSNSITTTTKSFK